MIRDRPLWVSIRNLANRVARHKDAARRSRKTAPGRCRAEASFATLRPSVKRTLLLLLTAILAGAASPGAGGESQGPEAPAESAIEAARVRRSSEPPKEGVSWFALPVLFWLPETKLGYGGTGGLHFHLGESRRASSVFLVGAYTVEGQGSADVAVDLAFPKGTAFAARFRAVHFPDAFYGLGPDSTFAARESFTRRYAEAVGSVELAVLPNRLRGGLRFDVRGEEIRDVQPGGLLDSGALPGVKGFGAVGLGASVTWDTRDRPLFPSRGTFAQAWLLHYPGALGGHDGFTRGAVEGRAFLPLGRERLLGVAAFLEECSEDTPFTLLPRLGSTRFLRGWREGRFRDHVAWAAQGELRLPLVEGIWGAAFGAFGDVAPSFASLRADTLKVAGGLGLRFRLTPEGANIRLDVAGSEAGAEVYVLVLEAF